jgi:hypothetical protein
MLTDIKASPPSQGVVYSVPAAPRVEVTMVQYNKMLVYIYVPIVFKKMGQP